MRSHYLLITVLALCALMAFGRAQVPSGAEPASFYQHQLQEKAEHLTRAYLRERPGCVVVTVRQGEGLRREERQLLAPQGHVVSSQRKKETYRSYRLECVSEKVEIPRSTVHQVQQRWIESVQVAVVVPPGTASEPLVQLLESGLALRPDQGDRVVVARSL